MSVPVQFFMLLHDHYQDYTPIHDLYVAFKSSCIKSSSMNFIMTTLKFETGSDSPIKSCYTYGGHALLTWLVYITVYIWEEQINTEQWTPRFFCFEGGNGVGMRILLIFKAILFCIIINCLWFCGLLSLFNVKTHFCNISRRLCVFLYICVQRCTHVCAAAAELFVSVSSPSM